MVDGKSVIVRKISSGFRQFVGSKRKKGKQEKEREAVVIFFTGKEKCNAITTELDDDDVPFLFWLETSIG